MDIKKIVFKNLDGSLRKVNIVNSINGIDIPESGAVILDTIKDISADGSSLTVTKSDGSSSKVTLNASGGVKTVNNIQPDESGNITIPTGSVKTVNNVQPDESGNVLLNVVKTVNNTEPDISGNVTIDAGKVKTVNSAEPDSNGNITIQTGTVNSVNNIQPDEQGNVTLSIVKTVNGNTPDISGNVTIDAGTVKTVDGKAPDTNGNVALNAIKSINGNTPNATGDIELAAVSDVTLSGKNLNIESTNGNTRTLVLPFSDVKTVNNTQPNENGNIELNVVSDVRLSGKNLNIESTTGNIRTLTLPFSDVKTVNNIQPDSNGNVAIGSHVTNIVGVTDNRNLGEIFTSSIPLESSQVHLLDGSVLTDATELYDYLKSIKDTNPDLFTTDSEFNSEVQSSGKCNKFVIKVDNKTVRIPKGDSNNYIVIKNYDTKFEFNQPFSLLEPKWSDVPLNNLSWLLSNGQVNSSKNYPSVYELLLNEYNSGELKTETISGTTIQYKQLGNGHKIVTDKTAYNSILSKTGTAWYYLLDLEAKTFILPKTNGYMKCGNSNQFIKQSLPNIKGQFAWSMSSGDDETSAPFSKKVVSNYGIAGTTSASGKFIRYGFDASTSSDIYADGANVNPNSVQGYLYFYVGECVGTANSVNLGDIKDKLDLDVNNIKTELTTLKSDISSYAFPGPKYEELTIPASKTSLIAPENGWFMYQSFGSGSIADYMFMGNNSNLLQSCQTRDSDGKGVYASLPVKKGDPVYFEWCDSATTRKLRFIYASDKVRE